MENTYYKCLFFENNIYMRYFEDEDFIKKQLFDSEIDNVNKLLKRFFEVKNKSNNNQVLKINYWCGILQLVHNMSGE